jgi:hypothetical protein
MFGALRRGIGKADRAGEIADFVDLDQREAGMLLVIGTKAAIIGAAEFGAVLEAQRLVAGLEKFALPTV